MEFEDDYTGYGNYTLYKMCEEKPLHNDVDVVKSKLWIIGRAYSAAIERKAGKNFDIDSAAQRIIESDIDSYIQMLNKIQRPDLENIEQLLSAHSYLTKLLVASQNGDLSSKPA